MNILWFLVGLGAGIACGLLIAYFLRIMHTKTAKELAESIFEKNLDTMKAHFGNLSLDALQKSTDELMKLSASERVAHAKELDGKKSLIDEQLKKMTFELEKVTSLVRTFEKDREQKFGELSNNLRATGEQTAALMKTTSQLRETLASQKARGQWGERMAEDVLRMAGFVENINYRKQKTIESVGSRPDFTFLLPRDLKLNMDVKFPYDRYVKFIETENEVEKEKMCTAFLRDVRLRIKEVATREYINPEENTVDYALLFIPNEQIYSFIHEKDSTILDEGIKNKVVICSPITLFAVLSVIRQAVDNFAIEKTSNEIIMVLATFKKQVAAFFEKFDTLGKKIEEVQKEYDLLTTTRKRKLDIQLQKVEDLRAQRGLLEESE